MTKITEKQKIKNILDFVGIKYKSRNTVADLKSFIKAAKQDIDFCVNFHEKHKSSYFWVPPQSAASRRYEEQKKCFTNRIGNFEFTSDVSCSCKNYYYTGVFYENGVKKDLKCFKRVQKMLEEISL